MDEQLVKRLVREQFDDVHARRRCHPAHLLDEIRGIVGRRSEVSRRLDELGDRVARIFQTHLDPHPRLEVPKPCANRQSKGRAVLLASFSRGLRVEHDVKDPIDVIGRWLSHHANLATESARKRQATAASRLWLVEACEGREPNSSVAQVLPRSSIVSNVNSPNLPLDCPPWVRSGTPTRTQSSVDFGEAPATDAHPLGNPSQLSRRSP